MDEIEMAVDAGHAPFTEERMGRLAAFTHRPNAVGDMATSAGHAALSAHDVPNFIRKGDATSLPYLRIVKVIRKFGDDIARSRCDVGICFDEPIGLRDVAVAATRPDACGIAAMR